MSDATCSIDGCGKPRKTRGLCRSHYQRWIRHGDAMPRTPIVPVEAQTCTVEGCDVRREARGYCVKHLRRWDKYGDVHRVDVDWNTDRRFASKYVVNDAGCWIWQGKDVNQFGHARWVVRGQRIGVHRWSYERHVGPIPDGMVIDHLCRVPACVNPTHLEPVTQGENVLRAPTALPTINAAKTHCLRDHPLSGPNLYIAPRDGSRHCRECARASWQRHNAKRRRPA